MQKIEVIEQSKRFLEYNELFEIYKKQALHLFINFIDQHLTNENYFRFYKFYSTKVNCAFKRMNSLFFILNEDETLRSFLIIGGISDDSYEIRIEMICGDVQDCSLLLNKIIKLYSNVQLISYFSYPIEDIIQIFEQKNFKRSYVIIDNYRNFIKAIKLERISEGNEILKIEKINY